MGEKSFVFSKSTPVVIYGCSKYGIEIYHQLVDAGYTVPCFIDCRAQELCNVCCVDGNNVPVYRLEEYSAQTVEPIFFIAIRNAIEQTNVAKKLWQRRFRKAVFFPILRSGRWNRNHIESLKTFYLNFMEGKMDDTCSLPVLELLWQEKIFWDHARIQEQDGVVLAWMPTALLHYYNAEGGEKFTKKRISPDLALWNKNVYRLRWLNELFRFFIKGEGDLEYYDRLERLESETNILKDAARKENQMWFADRQECVEYLSLGLNMEENFLIQSAIPVQWNENGYFNICDGSHRLVFLSSMEMRMAPVKLSAEDYKKWINYDVLEQLVSFLDKYNITAFETPIPHPWFYECKAKEERFGRTILKCILERMDDFKLRKDFSVLDTNPGVGYYLQYFARTDEAGKIVGIVQDPVQFELITYLNRLFYLDRRIQLVKKESAPDEGCSYDVVLMLKTLCDLERQEQLQYIKWIESKTNNILIWESGVDYESEKEFIMRHSKFQTYIFLKRTLSDNIIREVGVFMK